MLASSTLPGARFVRMDLADKESIDKLFAAEKFDKVVNLAAQAGVRNSITNPYAYMQSNMVGFLKAPALCVVQFCLWLEREGPVQRRRQGRHPGYFVCSEQEEQKVQPDMSPMLFARAISKGEPIKVFNNGDMIRDFTYIDDIAEGSVHTLDHMPVAEKCPNGVTYKVYNIGC